MTLLQKVVLRGFKSIRDMELELRPLNVLIGANGAGKSNLIQFFEMLLEEIQGHLQQFVVKYGGAHSLLRRSLSTAEKAAKIEATLFFSENGKENRFGIEFPPSPPDRLAFFATAFPDAEATLEWLPKNWNNWSVHHFNDTTTTSPLFQHWYIDNILPLAFDGGNLAIVLYRLKQQNDRTAYNRIVRTIRMVAPFFDDFNLKPDVNRNVMLNWRHVGSSETFGPHQLSDGTLRAMCLITLLLQPENELPELIIVDEPELGLHPYALNLVASLFKKASQHSQVLVSTQSSAFLDDFTPEDVIVADYEDNESKFRRLKADELESWLKEYSLGEIWEKNVIQGGPH
jgi:predicted ATPase